MEVWSKPIFINSKAANLEYCSGGKIKYAYFLASSTDTSTLYLQGSAVDYSVHICVYIKYHCDT